MHCSDTEVSKKSDLAFARSDLRVATFSEERNQYKSTPIVNLEDVGRRHLATHLRTG